MEKERSLKVSEQTHKMILIVARKEDRKIKSVVKRAIEFYAKKGGK